MHRTPSGCIWSQQEALLAGAAGGSGGFVGGRSGFGRRGGGLDLQLPRQVPSPQCHAFIISNRHSLHVAVAIESVEDDSLDTVWSHHQLTVSRGHDLGLPVWTQAGARAGGQLGRQQQQPRQQVDRQLVEQVAAALARQQQQQRQAEQLQDSQADLEQPMDIGATQSLLPQQQVQQQQQPDDGQGAADSLLAESQLQQDQLPDEQEAELDLEQPQQRHNEAAQSLMPQQQQTQQQQANAGQGAAAGMSALPQLHQGQHSSEQEVSEAEFDGEDLLQQQATGRGWGAQEAAAMQMQLQQQQVHPQQAQQGVDGASAVDGELVASQTQAGAQQAFPADGSQDQPLSEDEVQEVDERTAAVMQQEEAVAAGITGQRW